MSRFFARESPAINEIAHANSGCESLRDSHAMLAHGNDLPTVNLLGNHPATSDTQAVPKARSKKEASLPHSMVKEAGATTVSLSGVTASVASIAHADAIDATMLHPTQPTQTHSRHDAITGRWTIFAVGRDERPNDSVIEPPSQNVAFECPFCSGHESQTPPSVLEINAVECESMTLGQWHYQTEQRPSNDDISSQGCDSAEACQSAKPLLENPGKPWAIRVIPNKFPAVDAIPVFGEYGLQGGACVPEDAHGPLSKSRREDPSQSLFRSRLINGGHEVFIESPDHEQSIVTLDLAQVVMLFRAYQMRMSHWRKVPSICYVSLFKNAGPAAGASLHHSHSQLIATSELPFAAKAVADRMKLHWAKTGCCLQCDVVRAEVKAKERVVAMTDSLVAYCPFGSHLPMLLRITTKRHLDCFESLSISELQELARLVRRSIQWLQQIYPDVAYNYLIHTRPPGVGGEEMAHWSLEIFPRVTQIAGFEWSSDCMINPMLPEIAAAKYREIARGENPLR